MGTICVCGVVVFTLLSLDGGLMAFSAGWKQENGWPGLVANFWIDVDGMGLLCSVVKYN